MTTAFDLLNWNSTMSKKDYINFEGIIEIYGVEYSGYEVSPTFTDETKRHLKKIVFIIDPKNIQAKNFECKRCKRVHLQRNYENRIFCVNCEAEISETNDWLIVMNSGK